MRDFDINHIENILNRAKSVLQKSKMIERETKYKYLHSFYSKAYMLGSWWYIGPTIKEYIDNKDCRTILNPDRRLMFLYWILDNNKFPPVC